MSHSLKILLVLFLFITSCSYNAFKNEDIDREFEVSEEYEPKVETYELTGVKNPEKFVNYYLKSKISLYNSSDINQIAENNYKLALENPEDKKIQENAFILLLANQSYAKALTIYNNKTDDALTFEQFFKYSQLLAQNNNEEALKILTHILNEEHNLPFLKILDAYFKFSKSNNLDELADNILSIKSNVLLNGFKYYYIARAYEANKEYEQAFKLYYTAFKTYTLRTPDVFSRMVYTAQQSKTQEIQDLFNSNSKYGENIYLVDNIFIDITNIKPLKNSLKDVSSQIFYDLGWSINQTTASLAGLDFLALADYIAPSDKIKFQLATGYLSNKWYNKATEILEPITKESSYYISSQIILADIVKKDDNKKAIQIIKNLQLNSNISDDYIENILGQIYLNNHNYTQAITSFNKVLAKDKSAKVYFSRAVAYEKTNKIDDAIADLKKSLELNPKNPITLNYLGYLLIDLKHDTAKGLEYIIKSVKLDPTNSSSLDSLGWAYIKQKEYKKGLEMLERAYDIKPYDGVITGHLADAYLHNNRKKDAIIYWKKALELEKDDKREIQRIKNQLYKYNK
jgi:tetratricopeptide (TPR) repeat protein